MKLAEIRSDAPLIIQLIHQRMGKGENVFLYDDHYMTDAEKIEHLWRDGQMNTFRVFGQEYRDMIYDDRDLEKLELHKRSAGTWQVTANNEAPRSRR